MNPMGRLGKVVLAVLFLLQYLVVGAQTIFAPGEIAIIGASANIGACGGSSGEDLISFVTLVDLETGTELDLTDNGWESGQEGFFGNREGALRMRRSGPTLPAGTIFTIAFPTLGGTPVALFPDAGWEFTRLNTQTTGVNLNANGDQLYLMQGGVWDDGDTGFSGFLQNARYVGGTLLYAFNTLPEWIPLQNNSSNSGLHPEVGTCFQFAPVNSGSDFLVYNGPADNASPYVWFRRLIDPANWRSFTSCTQYTPPVNPLVVGTPNLDMRCVVCQACGPVEETLNLPVPTVAGPLTATILANGDTLVVPGLFDKATITLTIDTTTRFLLLALADTLGCPVPLDTIPETTTVIAPKPEAFPAGPLQECEQNDGTGFFNLSQLNGVINGNSGLPVTWFRKDEPQTPIPFPNAYSSLADTVIALVGDPACPSDPVEVALQVGKAPRVSVVGGGFVCDTTCHVFEVQFQGTPPFRLDYELITNGQALLQTLTSDEAGAGISICPPADGGARPEAIAFVELSDAECPLDLNTTFPLPAGAPAINDLSLTLCPGDSIVVNGTVYGPGRRTGREVIPGAADNGCDSIINVTVNFSEAVSGSLAGDTLLCRGDSLRLRLALSGAPEFAVTMREGDGLPFVRTGLTDGAVLSFAPEFSTTYELVSIQPVDSECATPVSNLLEVEVSDLAVTFTGMDRYNGFGVRCAEGADGSLDAAVVGNFPPVRFLWSTGDTTREVSGLTAGIYGLTLTDAIGCRQELRTELAAPQPLTASLEAAPAVCPGDEAAIRINAITGGTPPYRYRLNGGVAMPIVQLPVVVSDLDAGSYAFEFTDANECTTRETIVLEAEAPASIDLGPDRTIARGDSVQLSVELDFVPARLIWTPETGLTLAPDRLSATAMPATTTTYTVTAFAPAGCVLTDQATVRVTRETPVYTPTVFSPDADGVNDRFTLFGGGRLESIVSLRIYDRWGNLVFEGENLTPGNEQEGWDGNRSGQPAPMGVYLYRAVIRLRGGTEEGVAGDLMLIR